MDFYPTTAYLLAGESCQMSCAFCSQGKKGYSGLKLSRLSRISWPAFKWPRVTSALAEARGRGLKRVCLQAVKYAGSRNELKNHLGQIRGSCNLPVSVSAWLTSVKEVQELFESGAQRVAVAIDVVNPEAFARYKGGRQEERLRLLFKSAEKYPGKISTHLICGLGESEKEMLSLINSFLAAGITTGLFAFTPLQGTVLEKSAPPALDTYRRVQIGHYLLRTKKAALADFQFSEGNFTGCALQDSVFKEVLKSGEAFQTSGCPDCNRPYYNDHPGRLLYNYHYPPSGSETEAAILQSGLIKGE